MSFLLGICHDDSRVPSEGVVSEIYAWDGQTERRALRKDGRPLHPPGAAATGPA